MLEAERFSQKIGLIVGELLLSPNFLQKSSIYALDALATGLTAIFRFTAKAIGQILPCSTESWN